MFPPKDDQCWNSFRRTKNSPFRPCPNKAEFYFVEEYDEELIDGASYLQVCRPCYEDLGSPKEKWFALKLK